MATFGRVSGSIYCLGRINVVAPGTPVPLNTNVPTTEAIGNTGAPMKANQMLFKAPGGAGGAPNTVNVGNCYVCFKGGNRTISNSIITDIAPGGSIMLGSSGANGGYQVADLVIDADNAGDGLRVTILNPGIA